jgi:hypothetical protein
MAIVSVNLKLLSHKRTALKKDEKGTGFERHL